MLSFHGRHQRGVEHLTRVAADQLDLRVVHFCSIQRECQATDFFEASLRRGVDRLELIDYSQSQLERFSLKDR